MPIRYPGLQKLYTKTTVSELKIAAMAEKDEAVSYLRRKKWCLYPGPAENRKRSASRPR